MLTASFLFSKNYLFLFIHLFGCTRSELQKWGLWSSLHHARSFGCSMKTLGCGMMDLVAWPGIEPRPPASGMWSLNHWTTKEVPDHLFPLQKKKKIWICSSGNPRTESPELYLFSATLFFKSWSPNWERKKVLRWVWEKFTA